MANSMTLQEVLSVFRKFRGEIRLADSSDWELVLNFDSEGVQVEGAISCVPAVDANGDLTKERDVRSVGAHLSVDRISVFSENYETDWKVDKLWFVERYISTYTYSREAQLICDFIKETRQPLLDKKIRGQREERERFERERIAAATAVADKLRKLMR